MVCGGQNLKDTQEKTESAQVSVMCCLQAVLNGGKVQLAGFLIRLLTEDQSWGQEVLREGWLEEKKGFVPWRDCLFLQAASTHRDFELCKYCCVLCVSQ